MISPESITKMFKFNNSPKFKKVKFTDPLITSTFYVECYIDKYNSNENLNLFPNQEKKYNENTNMSSLETSNVELNVNEYSCNLKIECDESTSEYVNPVMKYELLDIKEEHIETSTTKKYVDSFGSYINHNPRPNTRVVKMMKLLQKNNIKTSDRIDVDKNLLPLHVSNILDNNENKTSEDMIADGNNLIFTGKLDKEVNNEGNIINNDMIIKDNCGLVITDICSKQSIYDISNDNSEDDFSKDNQITNEKDISVVTDYLNESDQCFHSSILDDSSTTDSVEIRKKLRNVVRQRIINGSVKEQKLSETFKINKFPKYGDNENNSSYNDNPTESISNENFNFNDVQELSSGEDDMPSFRINGIYSLDPNYHRPLQIHRTLRKVSDFYNVETHGNTDSKSPMYENEYIAHDNILKKFSKDYQTYDNNKYKTKMNRKKFFPTLKRNIKTPKNKFPKLNNSNDDEIMNVIDNIQNSIDSDNDNDNEEVIHFSLTNSYNEMYEELLKKFNNDENSMFMHLMENQRMLFNGELILSDNANTEASNYIIQHLNELHEWYGNPKNTDAHQSYLQHTLALNSQLLVDKESSSDTNDIINVSSSSSVYSNDSTSVINISLDEELDIEDLISNSSSEMIDIDDISDTSLSMSDQSDTSTSIMTNDLMSFDEISDIQENNTTETVETDDTISSLNFFSSGYQNLAKKNDIPFNQETHIQDDVTTTTTFSTSKPITSSKIFNLYNQAIIDKPMYNFQLPTAEKCTSANLSKPVQPSFQIPTAVRSKGTPLMQTNKLPFLQLNLNTNIRHVK